MRCIGCLTRLLTGMAFGAVVALVCMGILPMVFSRRGLYAGLAAVLVGVVLPEGLRGLTRRACRLNEPVCRRGARVCLWLAASVGLYAAARVLPHGLASSLTLVFELCLGCAGGVLLYVACGYMLPDGEAGISKRRVLAMLGAGLGFVLGVLISMI